MSDPYWQRQEQKRWEEIREREKKIKEQQEIDDIDGAINWAYGEMRKIEHYLETVIENAILTDTESKRLDKAAVVMRTGFKMLKKVIKTRAPHLCTSDWRDEAVH
jgi:hypothetical protein